MTRLSRLALLLAGLALAAGLAAGACAGRGEPDSAYLDSLHGMTAPQLLHEHNALRIEETALTARLAEAHGGELPAAAREGAERSLEESLHTVQAKRRAVDQTLAEGRYANSEKRYPVQQLVLRAKPPAEAEAAQTSAPTPETAGGASEASPAPAAPAAPAPAKQTAPTPAPPVQPAPRIVAKQTPAPPPAERDAPAARPAPEKPAAPAPAATPAPARAGIQVRGVDTARTPEGLEVRVRLEGSPARKLFTMTDPPRIVLDLLGVDEPAFRPFYRTLAVPEAQTLRLGWHDAKAMLRLVLDTDAAHLAKGVVQETADGLVLRVTP